MNLVVVIPAYNEERTIGEVVRRVSELRFCDKSLALSAPPKLSFDQVNIIVVDDGSQDRTAEVARAAGALVLRHPINRGLGAALATGIEAALRLTYNLQLTTYNSIIVTLDADGQHDPAEINRVVEPILTGKAETALGVRSKRQMPILRVAANWCGNFFTWLLFGLWVSDSQSGFRAFRADAAEKLRLRTSTMEVSSEIIREIVRLKLKLVEVPITVRYTPYSLAKGQGFFRGLETLWKLIMLKFFR